MLSSRRAQDRELTRPGEIGRAAERRPNGSGNGPLMLCLAAAVILSVGSLVAKMGGELRGTVENLHVPAGHGADDNAAAGIAAHTFSANRLAELQREAVDGPATIDNRPYDYDLVIVVPAAAGELSRRDAVRGSWARYLTSPLCEACRRYKMHMVFVVGNEGNITASHQEAAEKGDLGVLEDFGQDAYYTMRSKKTLQSIRYAVQHFTFRFLLKCDTDSWVYVDRLLEFFESKQLWNKALLYAGNFKAGDGATANLDEDSKWYDPLYPVLTGFDRYPKHAKGAGYVLSRLLAEALANEPDEYWADVPCEDVAVGFWLSAVRNEKLELPVSLDPACSSAVLVDHYITPEVMAERWQAYEKFGSPCQSAPAVRGSQVRIETDKLGEQ